MLPTTPGRSLGANGLCWMSQSGLFVSIDAVRPTSPCATGLFAIVDRRPSGVPHPRLELPPQRSAFSTVCGPVCAAHRFRCQRAALPPRKMMVTAKAATVQLTRTTLKLLGHLKIVRRSRRQRAEVRPLSLRTSKQLPSRCGLLTLTPTSLARRVRDQRSICGHRGGC